MGRPWEVVFTLLIALQGVRSLPAGAPRSPGLSGTAQLAAGEKQHLAGGAIPSILESTRHVARDSNSTTVVPKPTSLLVTASVVASLDLSSPTNSINMAGQDIFADPISTDAPPAVFGTKEDHPVPRLGVQGSGPFETNKFYGSLQLGTQTSPVFLHPYSVAWARGEGSSKSWGLAISHVEASQRAYGPTDSSTGAAEYFTNPLGIHSVCLSAKELTDGTTLTTEELTDFSVRVGLRPSPDAPPAVQFPLVQGTGFITAVYDGATPVLQTGVRFKAVTPAYAALKDGVVKYKLELESGETWLAYATQTAGDPLDLEFVDSGLAQAKGPFSGFIQVAKDPGDTETIYDQAAGAYATGVQLSGSVDGATGTYTFSFQKTGIEGTSLVMFALPHHVASFDDGTKGCATDLKLQTTTKGVATAVVADSWTMVENDLPTNIGFLPWSPETGSDATISDGAKQAINEVAQTEIAQNIQELSNVDSMYFAGKVSLEQCPQLPPFIFFGGGWPRECKY